MKYNIEDNNCCGENELPSEELEQDQIYKVKSGFRVKGEVRLRGKRTDKLIILPEDRYEYMATGTGEKKDGNQNEFYHSSSSTEISSTLKSLFGGMIRTLSQPIMKTNKGKTGIITGDIINESDGEATLDESLTKVYEYVSMKQSETNRKPSKKTFKTQLQKFTDCFRTSQPSARVFKAVENFDMEVQHQNFVSDLDECISVEGCSDIVSENLEMAYPCEPYLLLNGGDVVGINLFKPTRKIFNIKPKYVTLIETKEKIKDKDNKNINTKIKFNYTSKKPLVISRRKIGIPLSVRAEKLIMKQLTINDTLANPHIKFNQIKNKNSTRFLYYKNNQKPRSFQKYLNYFSNSENHNSQIIDDNNYTNEKNKWKLFSKYNIIKSFDTNLSDGLSNSFQDNLRTPMKKESNKRFRKINFKKPVEIMNYKNHPYIVIKPILNIKASGLSELNLGNNYQVTVLNDKKPFISVLTFEFSRKNLFLKKFKSPKINVRNFSKKLESSDRELNTSLLKSKRKIPKLDLMKNRKSSLRKNIIKKNLFSNHNFYTFLIENQNHISYSNIKSNLLYLNNTGENESEIVKYYIISKDYKFSSINTIIKEIEKLDEKYNLTEIYLGKGENIYINDITKLKMGDFEKHLDKKLLEKKLENFSKTKIEDLCENKPNEILIIQNGCSVDSTLLIPKTNWDYLFDARFKENKIKSKFYMMNDNKNEKYINKTDIDSLNNDQCGNDDLTEKYLDLILLKEEKRHIPHKIDQRDRLNVINLYYCKQVRDNISHNEMSESKKKNISCFDKYFSSRNESTFSIDNGNNILDVEVDISVFLHANSSDKQTLNNSENLFENGSTKSVAEYSSEEIIENFSNKVKAIESHYNKKIHEDDKEKYKTIHQILKTLQYDNKRKNSEGLKENNTNKRKHVSNSNFVKSVPTISKKYTCETKRSDNCLSDIKKNNTKKRNSNQILTSSYLQIPDHDKIIDTLKCKENIEFKSNFNSTFKGSDEIKEHSTDKKLELVIPYCCTHAKRSNIGIDIYIINKPSPSTDLKYRFHNEMISNYPNCVDETEKIPKNIVTVTTPFEKNKVLDKDSLPLPDFTKIKISEKSEIKGRDNQDLGEKLNKSYQNNKLNVNDKHTYKNNVSNKDVIYESEQNKVSESKNLCCKCPLIYVEPHIHMCDNCNFHCVNLEIKCKIVPEIVCLGSESRTFFTCEHTTKKDHKQNLAVVQEETTFDDWGHDESLNEITDLTTISRFSSSNMKDKVDKRLHYSVNMDHEKKDFNIKNDTMISFDKSPSTRKVDFEAQLVTTYYNPSDKLRNERDIHLVKTLNLPKSASSNGKEETYSRKDSVECVIKDSSMNDILEIVSYNDVKIHNNSESINIHNKNKTISGLYYQSNDNTLSFTDNSKELKNDSDISIPKFSDLGQNVVSKKYLINTPESEKIGVNKFKNFHDCDETLSFESGYEKLNRCHDNFKCPAKSYRQDMCRYKFLLRYNHCQMCFQYQHPSNIRKRLCCGKHDEIPNMCKYNQQHIEPTPFCNTQPSRRFTRPAYECMKKKDNYFTYENKFHCVQCPKYSNNYNCQKLTRKD